MPMLIAGPLLVAEPSPPWVLDLRDPGPGVCRLRCSLPWSYGSPAPLGDVDGDGYHDFLIPSDWIAERRCGDSVIVRGAPRGTFTVTQDIESLHQTHFVWNERFYAWGSVHHEALGDVDADGRDDFLMSSPVSPEGEAANAGTAFLVFGTPDLPAVITPTEPDAFRFRSVRFISRVADGYVGTNVASAGDINADGLLDYAIAAFGPGSEDGIQGAGKIYCVYGGLEASRQIELSEVGASVPGFTLHGAYGKLPGDGLGGSESSMGPAGDVDADGHADFVASINGTRITLGGGAVYIVRGGPGLPRDLYLARPGGRLLEMQGTGQFGASVVGAGDVDGDARADLLFGAPQAVVTYLVHGASQWPPSLRFDDPAVRKLELRGTRQGPLAPLYSDQIAAGASPGDWDADGTPDLLFMAPAHMVRFGSLVGECYLILGRAGLEGNFRDLDVGTPVLPGIRITGHDALVQLGHGVATGGDLDGDGRADLILAAPSRLNPGYPAEKSSLFVLFADADLGKSLAITAVEPGVGLTGGDTAITVRGRGFQGGEEVLLDGRRASDVHVVSSVELQARAPAARGPGPVAVEITRSNASVRLESGFTYVDRAYPDLVLEPATLRSLGHRVLSFRDTVQPASPSLGFLSIFFGEANGDGIDDLAIGTPLGTTDGRSRVVLLFGRREGFPDTIGPGELGSLGTAIDGSTDAPYPFGIHVVFPGDLSGDGFPEVLLDHYLVFGRETWAPRLELAEEIAAGRALDLNTDSCRDGFNAAPGDMDQNGVPDLVLSERTCNPGLGTVRLFLDGLRPDEPRPRPTVEITADPTVIHEPADNLTPEARRFGWLMGGQGDWNGDGRNDLFIGADHMVGVSYAFLGPTSDFVSASITEAVEAGRAVTVEDSHILAQFSRHTWLVGDVNGDGIDDAFFGVPGGGRDFHGASYLVYGSHEFGAVRRSIDVFTLAEGEGVEILGESPYDWAGHVSGLGDWNGDGFADIAIGGQYHRDQRARAYVVLGGPDLPRRIQLPALGQHGFTITGREGNAFSVFHSTLAAGDLDGDGVRDLAVAEADGLTEPGFRRRHVVVIFGKRGDSARFVRGEVNGDGRVDLADAVAILSHLFQGAGVPRCADALDANDDGRINLTDAVYLLGHLFLGSAPPPLPYSEPGADPTPDALDCELKR